MLFERPDKPCWIPHLRRRGIWQSVLFVCVSNSLYCIKLCDKSTTLAEEFKGRFEDGAWDAELLEVPLLRSLQPIEPSLQCFWVWMWWSHKLCNVSYKETQILLILPANTRHYVFETHNKILGEIYLWEVTDVVTMVICAIDVSKIKTMRKRLCTKPASLTLTCFFYRLDVTFFVIF